MKNKDIDFTIIIPVYNTSPTILTRCFDSVSRFMELQKSKKQFGECIIVDDGSDSFVEKFCKSVVDVHACYRYIRKDNGGVSSARNLGLDNANGSFVCFVDADDELMTDSPIELRGYTEADILLTDLIVIRGDKKELWKPISNDAKSGIVSKKSILTKLTSDGKANGPYCKFIRRSLIEKNRIRFRTDMVTGEDLIFFVELLFENPKLYYINKPTYKYYLDDSTSDRRLIKFQKISIYNNITMYSEMMKLINYYNLDNSSFLRRSETERYIKQIFNTAAELYLNNLYDTNISYINEAVKAIDDDEVYDIKKHSSIKYKIEYNVLANQYRILLYILGHIRKLYLKKRIQ